MENCLLCSLARVRIEPSSHGKGEAPSLAEVRVEEKSAGSYFSAGVGDLAMKLSGKNTVVEARR